MLDLETDVLLLRGSDRVVLQAYLLAEQTLASQRPTTQRPTTQRSTTQRSTTVDATFDAAADADEEEQNERTRWVARIREIEGVPQDCLAPSHGRLIALGHLQFQLQGRDAGVVYRITSTGRAVLAAAGNDMMTTAPLRRSA